MNSPFHGAGRTLLRPRTLSPSIAAVLAIAAGSAGAQEADATAQLLERLDKLEQRLSQVEQENATLKEQLKFRTERLERTEQRAAKAALPGVVPSYASVNNDYSFKLRGVIDADAVSFDAGKGGYDYNSGTAFRRARIGLEGDAFRDFKWRIESDFAGNVVGITDAYVQFVGYRPWAFTFGQHKAPYGLESNNSDNFNTFLERGIFTNAFGNAGAERRIGLSAFYGTDTLTLGFGVFGDNESSTRLAAAPDESVGVNGRVTWAPLFEPGHVLQLGLSGYYRGDLKEGNFNDAVRFSDRPNVRVDGGVIADTGVIRQVDSLKYLGAEGVYVNGPFSLVGEYGRATADRYDGLDDPSFSGYYVYGSWFLTGESRTLKTGSFDRVKPWRDFDWRRGTLGAFELALRFDRFDFSDTPVLAQRGNEGDTVTAALNWYLNPNLKFMFNYIHFQGTNTPLDPIGRDTRGDALAARLHLDW